MKETKFKVLMYMGEYVDITLLGKGIYVNSIPSIYSSEETMDTLIAKYRTVFGMTNSDFINEAYFDNLRLCVLMPIEITEAGDRALLIAQIREAFADYVKSEGCSCCQDGVNHEKANLKLAQLLGADPYEDGSGINWAVYESKPIES